MSHFKKKTILKIIRKAINSYDTELCTELRASLSSEQEARLNGLLLSYKDGVSYLGWISKDFENPSLQSILDMIDQLSDERILELPMTNIKIPHF